MKAKKIVLTGASVSGKTTVLERLKKDLNPLHTRFVEEGATCTLSMGYLSLISNGSVKHWQDPLQRSIYTLHTELEQAIENTLEDNAFNLVICDRGCLDGMAYYDGSEVDYEHLVSETKEAMYSRYDKVIMLTTLAADTDRYNALKHNNPYRITDANTALVDHMNLYNVWSEHPNFVRLDLYDSEEELYQAVLEQLEEYIYIEREYKFKVLDHKIISELKIPCIWQGVVKQFYLKNDTAGEVRFREICIDGNFNYSMTIKMGELPNRKEYEVTIPRGIGTELFSQGTKLLSKERHYGVLNGVAVFVDYYENGDVIIEVEDPTGNSGFLQKMKLAVSYGDLEDVTTDDRYKAANMWQRMIPNNE